MAAAALIASALAVDFVDTARSQSPPDPLDFTFTEIAARAGLTAVTTYGGRQTNRYLLETTGSGTAAFDYDDDGWLDLFVVNGSTLEGFPKGKEPTSHLYRNRRDGTFEDVTDKAGVALSGWGQAACAGDYDNDGHEDLFVTFWGKNRLFRNRGDGTFEETTRSAGVDSMRTRWGAGCAFLDYDRDGRLDLFAANYIDLDLKTAPVPESGLCRYKGVPVACGPPGLTGGKNVLYRNTGDGHFADVSDASGITRASGTYGLGVSTLDFDDDGWVDLYVANDSNPSALYRNNRDGTFADIGVTAGCAYSQDGKPQAGMGVAIGDYNRDGRMDVFKTNFAGDTSTLYMNSNGTSCEDRTFASGIGRNTRWLGWGVSFLDLDLDGWLDLFLVNGHVYPEVEQLKTEAGYRQRKVVYHNRGNGRFDDVTERLGPPVTVPKAGRGAAFADLDNDGDLGHSRQQRARAAGFVSRRSASATQLAHGPADWYEIQPQRHRRAAARDRGNRDAGAGGSRRRQLLLAKRSASELWSRLSGEGRPPGGPMAERPRGNVVQPRGESNPDVEGRHRPADPN